MNFFAILCALLIEQVKPLPRSNAVYAALRSWVRWSSRNFDTGQRTHAWVAWILAVLLPSLLALAIHWALLLLLGWPFAVLWSVAVLYATLGFRQFSHHFTEIRDALDAGDETLARQHLANWQQVDASELPRSEIVRHVIEYSVLAAHRHVFGVFAWFAVLATLGLGPAGAVFYRLAEFVSRYWHHKASEQGVSPALQQAAVGAWRVLDWLPARITAVGFAVVGSFEDAIDSWRTYAKRLTPGMGAGTGAGSASIPDNAPDNSHNDGVILAATAGAVNVRLGGQGLKTANVATSSTEEALDSESTPGREPEIAHLRSVVGLVWRSVVLWMVLLALLTLAKLLG